MDLKNDKHGYFNCWNNSFYYLYVAQGRRRMKKLLLGVLLGFLLHKGFYAIYSYAWWTAEASQECRAIPAPLSNRFKCIDDKISPLTEMSIILLAPSYTFRKWEWYF